MDAADVDPRQPFEREAAGGELVPVFVEEVVPERLRHAGTAVVGGAAADADDEMAGPLVVGALQQLADAVGGRDPGVAFRRRHEGQPRGLCHLDHGSRSGVDHAVAGVHRIAQRAAHLEGPSLAMRGGDERVDGAVAPIGNWHQHEVRVGRGDANAFGNRLRSVQCR